MSMKFHPVPLQLMTGSPSYARPTQALAAHVEPDSPATQVMTDLRQTAVITIGAFTHIDDALQVMICQGVRLLLVEGHAKVVMGLITATDLQGEKPLRFSQETRTRHDEILVRDIMTRVNDIEVMSMRDVQHCRVGDIVKTLIQAGRQHALVVEKTESDHQLMICGIFSSTQIGKQLGMKIEPTEKAQTFADLEMVIAS